MKFAYKGKHAAVFVPALGQTVKREEPVEIKDKSTADALKRQGWKPVKEEEKKGGSQ